MSGQIVLMGAAEGQPRPLPDSSAVEDNMNMTEMLRLLHVDIVWFDKFGYEKYQLAHYTS